MGAWPFTSHLQPPLPRPRTGALLGQRLFLQPVVNSLSTSFQHLCGLYCSYPMLWIADQADR